MTEFTPHVCVPLYGSGYCWCSPRKNTEIALDIAVSRNLTLHGAVAILREIRAPNVIRLSDHRDLLRANKVAVGGNVGPGGVA